LTYTGKTLIVKNLLFSLFGYEIEIRGIPEKYVKEIKTVVWGFIWEGVLIKSLLLGSRKWRHGYD
jgi:hypothetical protein